METPEEFGAYSGLKIAHVTDLHFGMEGQKDAWENLSGILRKTIKPDLLLVTGDIVDSPSEDLLKTAASEISKVNVPFMVCPGNHDRFPRGNRLFGWRLSKRRPSLAFDHAFKGNVATEAGSILRHKGWRIEVRGLDSALDADFSARGFINPIAFNTLSTRCEDGVADLSILLVHHHPMPIRSLEHRRQSAKTDLVNLTYLVNAGLLLENLAESRIDVVLHGHEHAANTACYGSLRDAHWRVAVIGGDSGTGADTRAGCSVARAGLNLLWGGRDRALHLTHVANTGGGWRATQQTTILTPVMAGRSRVIRRSADLRGVVDSEISKHISITRTRDMVITYRYSNWWLGPAFRFICENSTGRPSSLSLTVFSDRSAPERFEGAFSQAPERSQRWTFTCEIPERLRDARTHLELCYTLQGGALLTPGDWEAAREAREDGFIRSKGMEYTSVATHDDLALAAVELTLSLPADLSPDRVDVRVYSTDDLSRVEGDETEELLNRMARDLGQGTYHLRVPFPRAGRLFVLAWKPVEVLPPLAGVPALASAAEALRAASKRVANKGAFDLALYMRGPDESLSLGARGNLREGDFTAQPAEDRRVRYRGDTSIIGQAAWGVPCRTGKVIAGLEHGERNAVAVPIRLAVRDCPAHAVLRIAALDEVGEAWLAGTTEASWMGAVASVTHALVSA